MRKSWDWADRQASGQVRSAPFGRTEAGQNDLARASRARVCWRPASAMHVERPHTDSFLTRVDQQPPATTPLAQCKGRSVILSEGLDQSALPWRPSSSCVGSILLRLGAAQSPDDLERLDGHEGHGTEGHAQNAIRKAQWTDPE